MRKGSKGTLGLEVGIVGKHVYGNAYDCDEEVLSNEKVLKATVLDAVKLSKMHLVEIKSWRFGGTKGGVSVIALVKESHIAVHTWPKYRYATIDVYTCGEASEPEVAFEHICKLLRPKLVLRQYADRSSILKLQASSQGLPTA